MGWLDKYNDTPKAQDGTVILGSPEYAKAYREGTFADVPNPLEPVTITADKKTGKNILDQYPYYDQLTKEEKKYFNDKSSIGRAVRRKAYTKKDLAGDAANMPMQLLQGAGEMGQVPQSAMVEGIEYMRGKPYDFSTISPSLAGDLGVGDYNAQQRMPSEAWGFDTTDKPWYHPKSVSNFAMDAIVDPTLITGGAGLVRKPLQKGLIETGQYLTTQTPLKNTYKLNPNALKEVQEQMLVRARPIGQDPYVNMSETLKAKQAAGEELKWYQKNLLNPQTNPSVATREKYYGQWFADNPSNLDFYINPGTRNFADDAQIEILKARMPKSEAAKYSVKNFEDAKKLSNLHDTEYVLPKDMIQQLERFSVDDLPKLVNEYNQINTPHWLKGYKPIETPTASSIDNVRTENLSSGIKDTSQLLNEVLGEITQGSKNRKSIAEGNRWLEEWIKHPTTQKKIRDDIRIAKEYTNDDLGKLNELYLIEQQSKNFKPNTKEFSFLNQIDDTVQKLLTGDSQEHIHRGNWGVSYSHNIDPLERMYIEKGLTKPSNRHGSWVSRTPLLSQQKRIGTTIHEGTHDWVSDRAIKVSGMWNRSLRNTDPEILSDFRQWKSLREQGKNPVKEMGREKAYQAYLANPTEMHARLMELRKHLGHAPDTKVTPEYAKQVIDYLEKLPRNKRPIDVDGFLNVIEDDPAKLSELFNKFWVVPPAVIGTQGLMNQKESKPQQQLKNGGWLDSYQDGGVIEDDRGQWAHPGKVTKINSNVITMQGVNYPVLGISDVGDVQLMQPEQDYKFKGEKVTELPLARFGTSIKNKNNLHNFTQPTTGGWLDKYN